MALSYEGALAAQRVLASYLPVTPLRPAASLSSGGNQVYLKLETVMPTGTFKVRGALVSLIGRLERGPVREVIASSTGNHGAAVAYAARLLNVPARIFVPNSANPVKCARIQGEGAALEFAGADLAGAGAAAAEYEATHPGVFYLDDATDDDLLNGPAVISLEVLAQLPEVTELIIPMGDTALIRGVALAAKTARPSLRVTGVQAVGAPAYYLSWKAGVAQPTEGCDTIADGLATRTPVPGNVEALRRWVDEVVLVDDEAMVRAIRHLHQFEGVTAEPAGAAAVTAWLGRERLDAGGAYVVCLVSGGNLSAEVRQRAGL